MPPPPDRRRSTPGRSSSPSGGSGKPPTHGGKPAARGGKPAARGGKPAARGGEPAARGAKPAARGGKPAARGGKPAARGGKPAARGAKPAARGGKPAARGAKPGRRDGDRDDRRARKGGRGEERTRDDGRKGVPPPTGRGAAWGGLARRAAGAGGTNAPMTGSGRLGKAASSAAAEAFRAAGGREPDSERQETTIVRVDDDTTDLEGAARGAVRRGGGHRPLARPVEEATGRPSRKAAKLADELVDHVGPSTAPKLGIKLADAGRAFEAERYLDAKRILTGLAKRAPGSAPVRELHGLTLYRLGRWEAAAKELEIFGALTGSTEQHPVLADCYRALHRWDEVERLWRELREVSPSAELVAEGRIVFAGSLADRGDVPGAIAVVEPATRNLRKPREHHLRLLYVLGDLYERAGEIPRARAAFDRVLAADRHFGDAAARRRALS